VIGCSAGSSNVLESIVINLPQDFSIPIIIVRHISPERQSLSYAELLSQKFDKKVEEPMDKSKIEKGTIYVAPPGYHLLVEKEGYFSLSLEDKVLYCRPSIDLLFESAAHAFGPNLSGIILSGANSDGSLGLSKIKEFGGVTIAQNPDSALFPLMPKSAIQFGIIDYIMNVDEIFNYLKKINKDVLNENSIG
jgi:two-component system chemotaxis response regulator CheB